MVYIDLVIESDWFWKQDHPVLNLAALTRLAKQGHHRRAATFQSSHAKKRTCFRFPPLGFQRNLSLRLPLAILIQLLPGEKSLEVGAKSCLESRIYLHRVVLQGGAPLEAKGFFILNFQNTI